VCALGVGDDVARLPEVVHERFDVAVVPAQACVVAAKRGARRRNAAHELQLWLLLAVAVLTCATFLCDASYASKHRTKQSSTRKFSTRQKMEAHLRLSDRFRKERTDPKRTRIINTSSSKSLHKLRSTKSWILSSSK
jgi:hypothetical protein